MRQNLETVTTASANVTNLLITVPATDDSAFSNKSLYTDVACYRISGTLVEIFMLL